MKRILMAVALCAAATCSVAAFASVGGNTKQEVQSTSAQRASAIQTLDRIAKPEKSTYTRVADDDEDGACWYHSVGYTGCDLSPRSQCFSGAFVTKSFVSGGTCDPNENPWGG